MSDFLETEYKECLALLKYYDERHQSLLKFSAALSSGVPTLLLAIHGLKDLPSQTFWTFTFLISVASSIGLLVIFLTMVQTRLYFIYPVRQANAIRKYFLSLDENKFSENQMYLSTNFSAWKAKSTQTITNLFVCLQVGLFIGCSVFAYVFPRNLLEQPICISSVVGFVSSLIFFGWSSYYLWKSSKYHPDKSIHKDKDS